MKISKTASNISEHRNCRSDFVRQVFFENVFFDSYIMYVLRLCNGAVRSLASAGHSCCCYCCWLLLLKQALAICCCCCLYCP